MLWGKIEPDLENTNQTGGDGGNGMGTVFAPMGYVSHQLDEKWTVGFGAYAGFGDELEYNNDWAGCRIVQAGQPKIFFRPNALLPAVYSTAVVSPKLLLLLRNRHAE